MAYTLAESPSDPCHRKLRRLRCLRRRLDCYRVERTSSRAGVAPAEVQRLFTAHYYVNEKRQAFSHAGVIESRPPLSAWARSGRSHLCRESVLFLMHHDNHSHPGMDATLPLGYPIRQRRTSRRWSRLSLSGFDKLVGSALRLRDQRPVDHLGAFRSRIRISAEPIECGDKTASELVHPGESVFLPAFVLDGRLIAFLEI